MFISVGICFGVDMLHTVDLVFGISVLLLRLTN